ncbi:hypothetical protein Dimus_031383 [Dionaea muscipula]
MCNRGTPAKGLVTDAITYSDGRHPSNQCRSAEEPEPAKGADDSESHCGDHRVGDSNDELLGEDWEAGGDKSIVSECCNEGDWDDGGGNGSSDDDSDSGGDDCDDSGDGGRYRRNTEVDAGDVEGSQPSASSLFLQLISLSLMLDLSSLIM